MQNCAQEVHKDKWFSKEYSTWGNARNTFTNKTDGSLWIIDYIFKKLNSPEKINAWTSTFDYPRFSTVFTKNIVQQIKPKRKIPWIKYTDLRVAKDLSNGKTSYINMKNRYKGIPYTGIEKKFPRPVQLVARRTHISLSDHEPIASTMYIRKKGMFMYTVGNVCKSCRDNFFTLIDPIMLIATND